MGLVNMTEHYYTTDEVHGFLFRDTKTDPVEQTIRLREYINDLPETKVTFAVKDAIDARRASRDLTQRIMNFVGTWYVPDRYTGNSTQYRAVNPWAAHSFRYGDVTVECACGALISVPQVKSWNENPQDKANEHGETCPMDTRLRTDTKLWERRREAIVDSLYYGIGGTRLCSRLSTRGDSITKFVRRLEIDRDMLHDTYLQVRANTMAELRRRGYVPEEIAKVYGVSRSHVNREIDRRTDTSCAEIQNEVGRRTQESTELPVFGGSDDD